MVVPLKNGKDTITPLGAACKSMLLLEVQFLCAHGADPWVQFHMTQEARGGIVRPMDYLFGMDRSKFDEFGQTIKDIRAELFDLIENESYKFSVYARWISSQEAEEYDYYGR